MGRTHLDALPRSAILDEVSDREESVPRSDSGSVDVDTLMGDATMGGGPIRGSGSFRNVEWGRRGHANVRLGRYVLLRPLGAGSMGEVFAAYDEELDRRVAIKVLGRSVRSSARDRMRAEAKTMAKLAHPNVVQVYEVGEDDGEIFIAMEFIDGSTLAQWQSKAQRGWRDVLDAYRQAGEGLAAAHRAGVIHRDFKPNNAMLEESTGRLRVRVLDFGIARRGASITEDGLEDSVDVAIEEPRLTSGTGLLGTPAYMAPEQFGTADVTEAADQFALCVSIWEGLFGERPFKRESFVDFQGRRAELRTPKRTRSVPAWVRAAVVRGLSHEPEARWPSIDALLGALDHRGRSTRRNWVLGAGLAAAIGVGSWAAAGQAPEPCTGAEARLAEVWGEQHRGAVEQAIMRTRLPYARRARDLAFMHLDAFGATWVEMHTEACVATTVRGERSAQWMDLRMVCLDRARMGAAATVELLSEADAEVVDNVAQVVSALPPLEPCASSDILNDPSLSIPATEKPTVEAAQRRLDRAKAELTAGRFERAADILDGLEPMVADLAYVSIRIEVAMARAAASIGLAQHEQARAALDRAFELAVEHRSWRGMHEAAALQLLNVGMHLDEPKVALAAYRSLALRSASNDRERANVYSTLAAVVRSAGEYAEAEAHARRAIALLEGAGASGIDLTSARNHLATALMEQGRISEAEPLFARSVQTLADELGDQHPKVLIERNNYAAILGMQAKSEQAAAEFRAVYRARQVVLGPKHPKTLDTRCNLAITLQHLGRHEEAADIFREAIPMLEETLGAEHRIVGRAYLNQASALVDLRRYEAAEVSAAKAVEIWSAGLGAEHPRVGQATHMHAEILSTRGQLDAAQSKAEAALRIFEASVGEQHLHTAQTRLLLGLIAFEAEDYPRAREQLERAAATLGAVESEPQLEIRVGMRLARTMLRQGEDAVDVARAAYERAVAVEDIDAAHFGQVALVMADASWAAATTPEQRAAATGFAREALDRLKGASPSTDVDDALAEAEAWLEEHA